jgi:hypothetical protein
MKKLHLALMALTFNVHLETIVIPALFLACLAVPSQFL